MHSVTAIWCQNHQNPSPTTPSFQKKSKISEEFVIKKTHKPNEGLEARKASRQGWERWKELGDRHCHIVMWCVTGVTSNLVSFPIICMHLFDVNLLSTKRKGFASIQQVIPKSTLANPIAVRQEFPPFEGNFLFFLLRFDWRQWLTLQNHQDSPLGENILGVCLGRCCWSLETCWRGRRWQDGKQHVKQMRSKKNLCRICNHLYILIILAIGRWISDWATTPFPLLHRM